MALDGAYAEVYEYGRRNFVLNLTIFVTSDHSKNKSTIKWRVLTESDGETSELFTNSSNIDVFIDGNKVNDEKIVVPDMMNPKDVYYPENGEGTLDVTHNADGSRNLTFKAVVTFTEAALANEYCPLGNMTIEKTVALPNLDDTKPVITLTKGAIGVNSATINLMCDSNFNAYRRTLNGVMTQLAYGGSANTNFPINLYVSEDTNYTLTVQVRKSANNIWSDEKTITFRSDVDQAKVKVIVNGVPKVHKVFHGTNKVKKIYVIQDGKAVRVA